MSRRHPPVSEPAEDGWIWGSTRGGGGAPLRDTQGNTVTNLKKVIQGDVHVDHSPGFSPKAHGGSSHRHYNDRGYNDRDSYNNSGRYHRDEEHHGNVSPIKGLENHAPYQNRDPPPMQTSPVGHTVRGSFTNPNASMLPSEKALQLKKNREFQAALKEQVEEARRKKEAEKARLEEEKRRELDHYLRHQYKGEVPHYVMEKARKPVKRDTDHGSYGNGEEYDSGVNDTNRGAHRGRGGRRDDYGEHDSHSKMARNAKNVIRSSMDGSEDDYDAPPTHRAHHNGGPRHGHGGRRDDDMMSPREPEPRRRGRRGGRSPNGYDHDGSYDSQDNADQGEPKGNILNLLKKDPPRKNRQHMHNDGDSDYDSGDGRGGRDRDERDDRGQHRRRNKDGYVSQREYDDLSALCERLLEQQDSLSSEIKHQAEIIGSLSGKKDKSKNPNRLKLNTKAERSQSVQSRVTADKRRKNDYDYGNNRPLSTSEMEVPSGPSKGPRRRPQNEEKPVVKEKPNLRAKAVASVKRPRMPVVSSRGEKKVVAFGGRAPVLEKVKPEKAVDKSVMKSGLKLAKRNPSSRRNQEFDNYDQGLMKRQVQKEISSPQGGGGGGFAELARNSRKGPVVVTYEDDAKPNHSPVQQKLSNLKNRNANQNLELRGSSHHLAVEGDVIRGDELDSLLNKARNIRNMNG